MITLIHIAFDLIILLISNIFTKVTIIDFILILSVNLIDLDHLLSRPIFNPKRNSFKSHVFHKYWKYILVVAIILLFIRPVLFLGVGLISHFLLDYIDTYINKLNQK